MWSQFFEGKYAKYKDNRSDAPVIECHIHIFPEPFMINHAISIAIYDIDHRVELNDPVVFFRNQLHRPEDRRKPKTKLNKHSYKLTHIFKKYYHR